MPRRSERRARTASSPSPSAMAHNYSLGPSDSSDGEYGSDCESSEKRPVPISTGRSVSAVLANTDNSVRIPVTVPGRDMRATSRGAARRFRCEFVLVHEKKGSVRSRYSWLGRGAVATTGARICTCGRMRVCAWSSVSVVTAAEWEWMWLGGRGGRERGRCRPHCRRVHARALVAHTHARAQAGLRQGLGM